VLAAAFIKRFKVTHHGICKMVVAKPVEELACPGWRQM
jgi:hypothetical protein